MKALYQDASPDTIEAAAAQARRLGPHLTDEGRRYLQALLAMQQGLRVARRRVGPGRLGFVQRGAWRLSVPICVVALALAALVERVLVQRAPRYHGPIALAVFVGATIVLFFLAGRWARRRGPGRPG